MDIEKLWYQAEVLRSFGFEDGLKEDCFDAIASALRGNNIVAEALLAPEAVDASAGRRHDRKPMHRAIVSVWIWDSGKPCCTTIDDYDTAPAEPELRPLCATAEVAGRGGHKEIGIRLFNPTRVEDIVRFRVLVNLGGKTYRAAMLYRCMLDELRWAAVVEGRPASPAQQSHLAKARAARQNKATTAVQDGVYG